MRFLSAASGKSVWRGLDYHHAGRVKSVRQTGPSEYEGEVWGGAPEPYHVRIDVDHPRRSVCDCPHAKDRLVVCKHKVALFFAAFPDAEGEFLREVEEEEREYEAEMERWKAERRRRIEAYVKGLSASEARAQLVEALIDIEDMARSQW